MHSYNRSDICALCGVSLSAALYFGWGTSCPGKLNLATYEDIWRHPYVVPGWNQRVLHRLTLKAGHYRGGQVLRDDFNRPIAGWFVIQWVDGELTTEDIHDVVIPAE